MSAEANAEPHARRPSEGEGDVPGRSLERDVTRDRTGTSASVPVPKLSICKWVAIPSCGVVGASSFATRQHRLGHGVGAAPSVVGLCNSRLVCPVIEGRVPAVALGARTLQQPAGLPHHVVVVVRPVLLGWPAGVTIT